MATASEMLLRFQPYSSSNGLIRMPGAARTPALTAITAKVTIAMTKA